ncbi:signal peptide peptidase SppA [Sphingomonas sp.]|uniref:signal peptide peptidase SppA n=1 Tax=Sphingomonas sp. TaxID=28214 RepID=UPI00286ABEE7|nr:signal peptide peptidase SppA [Sphingomonas sp.]
MRLVRAIWKLLVGVKDMLVLLLLLLFFGGIYAALSIKPPAVRDGVLDLALNGSLVEQPSKPSATALLSGQGGRIREYSLREMVQALDAARTDDRVKAVALDLDGFLGGGQAAVGELGAAVGRVKAAGKPVLAYATGYTDDGYQLASHASEIWLNPLGTVAITGPGSQNLYYKGLLDKLGVTANVYRVGTYKSAVEPFIRNDMSPEAKAAAQSLGDVLLANWRDDVTKARPQAKVDAYLKDQPGAVAAAGGDLALAARNAGLVDQVGDRRLFERKLASIGGEDGKARGGYRTIRLDSYVRATVDRNPRGPIGIVTIAGMIVDGKAPLGTAGGDSIANAIRKGIADKGLKALVVRIDSPGGSVTAGERIRQALLAAKERKLPIVVSMGSVAASGGYWVTTPADYIYAEPSTITGSIGVFGILPSFQGTLQKLGVGADGIRTTPLSGEPDLFHGPSPEAGQLIQAGVDSIYRRFLAIVGAARHKGPADVDKIAQGRVWDGGTAHQIGLVDGFGNMDAAVAKAAELAKLGDERGVRYLERPGTLRDGLMDIFSGDDEDGAGTTDAFAALAPSPASQLQRALAEVQQIMSGPSIQARCLECGPVAATPQADGAKPGLMAMIARLLWS